MVLNFKNKMIVGVSVTPEIGLEVAQVDFATRTVVKYGHKQLAYDANRREIADLDIFKETLQDLLFEMQIPKGTELVLNIPAPMFKVVDYPASLTEEQVSVAIEEAVMEHPLFRENEGCVSAVALPNSTMQFNKIAYTVASKAMLIEIAMQIKEIGYSLAAIDTSVNSTLNALMYAERVNTSPDVSWVMLQVENNCCRVIPMIGRNYVDSYEERISIGEVLGDAENYSTVVTAVDPLLKNMPSQYLCIVSKTNIISAEALASKLSYGAPIIHQEANCFTKEPLVNIGANIDEDSAKLISPDVLGAAINRDFKDYSSAHINLFNSSLGDVYLLEQPPMFKFGSISFAMSLENIIKCLIPIAIVIVVIAGGIAFLLHNFITSADIKIEELDRKNSQVEKYLKANEKVSAEIFDEGDEIKLGLVHNKNVYSYYTIVGTEIPKKLWLTRLSLGEKVTIEGQADNLESVYGFFRNIKDYNPSSAIKLQKLGLATSSNLTTLTQEGDFDTDSIISSMNADYYQFKMSDSTEEEEEVVVGNQNTNQKGKKGKNANLPDLPTVDESEG